jgi:hypothetical protein
MSYAPIAEQHTLYSLDFPRIKIRIITVRP